MIRKITQGVTEKRKPAHDLGKIKTLIEAKKVRVTATALAGAAQLGLNQKQVLNVIQKLTKQDFYKSMTTHHDHTLWQDVYRPVTECGQIYIKLMIEGDCVRVAIISFKEK